MVLKQIRNKLMTTSVESVQSVPLRSSKGIASHQNRPLKAIKRHDIIKRGINAADASLFFRHELKYRIPEAKAQAVARFVQSYISPDRYARKCPNYEYPISSLYFDSNQLHLCKETMEDKTNRFKLRIRCYNDLPDEVCFFEIKRRINNVIYKSRARISKHHIGAVLKGAHVSELVFKRDKEAIHQFQFYVHSLNARPIVLVRYMRQAFENNSSNRVRVTFDRRLSFKTTHRPFVGINGSGWRDVSMDFVILEIKFTARYPLWLSEMVKVFDLKQTSMSKYVSSVKQSCALGFCAPCLETGIRVR